MPGRAAPCGGLNEVRFACDAAVMGALGRIIPERMTGDVRGTSNHTYIGGHDFLFYEYPSGELAGSRVAMGTMPCGRSTRARTSPSNPAR